MSRRYPEASGRSGAAKESGVARHRWAVSMGAAGEGVLPDGGTATQTAPPASFRWRTGRRAAVLLAVISVLLGGWFWWQAADAAPRARPLGDVSGAEGAASGVSGAPAPAGSGGGTADAAGPAGAEPSGKASGNVVVHVAGAVASPGVVELAAGSRLHDAVTAAGGSTAAADLDRLNLAAIVEDGQKVLVPERGSPDGTGQDAAGESSSPAGGTGATGGAGTPAGKINLNTAGVEELATLPRVGPVLAQRIVDWRKQHGRFSGVEELDAVDGIGPKLLEALLPLVRI